jgi:hypothetical protein
MMTAEQHAALDRITAEGDPRYVRRWTGWGSPLPTCVRT